MTELQLEFIRKFGRKDLTEGCITLYSISTINMKDSPITTSIVIASKNNIDDIKYVSNYEILGHPVQWHDVFARFINDNWTMSISLQLGGEYILAVYGDNGQEFITCNPCESPMVQPALIEQLLLLSN